MVIEEQLLLDLLHSKSIERLKKVNQYGIDYYIIKPDVYTRYDHSIGVMYLLRSHGASILEQASGLTHDNTHTIFSHVGDELFRKLSPYQSYQDEFFEDIMKMHGIDELLKPHGITISDINPHNGNFTMLERDLPDLCADRIEYNLQGGYVEGILTYTDVTFILQDLNYAEGHWYFGSLKAARLFAYVPLYLTLEVWSSAYGMLVDRLAADLLRYALDTKVISLADVHMMGDDEAWDKLVSSNDKHLQQLIIELKNYNTYYVLSDVQDYIYFFKGKFRGIDPLVMTEHGLQRLTEIDQEFAQEFRRVKDKINQGWFIKRKL